MEEHRKKPCKMCCEEMDARARRCPHCRAWQSRWVILSHPYAVALWCALVFAVPWAAHLVLLNAVTGFFDTGRDFAEYQNQLHVVHSDMVFGATDSGPVAAVVGRIRNDSDVTWSSVQIEVQFKDQQGRLVDTVTEIRFFRAILPGAEMPFKASVVAEQPLERYASWDVIVRSAREAGGMW